VATQIAALVEHHRRYLQLEIEAESMARTAKKQTTVSDQTQSAILAVINDGVVVSNAAGYVQFVNRAAERILGKSGQALLGQSIGTIYGEIDSKEAIDELLVSFSRRDQPLPTFLEEDDRAIQGRLIPWRDAQNEWLGIIAVFRDVTREVKADRARNDFIAALSHELRAPLTMVKGYSELIANGAIDAYPSQQLQAQQIIHSSTERIAEVLDNAIKVSAQNRHQVLPRFEEIDATKIIEKVVHEIIPIARLNEQKFTSDIDRNLIPIMADAKHIYRILYNLLSNACRFTPPGGRINLRVWIQPDLASLTREPSFCMTVQDNGTGIPKEDFSRVFDRFYRSKSQPLDGGGMGLGLTVVKELVELHNGRVWVESTVGSGSAFHVALPVRQEY
jgi:two-component system sensor histidine kinase VicK